jgi:hypothetical protein
MVFLSMFRTACCICCRCNVVAACGSAAAVDAPAARDTASVDPIAAALAILRIEGILSELAIGVSYSFAANPADDPFVGLSKEKVRRACRFFETPPFGRRLLLMGCAAHLTA